MVAMLCSGLFGAVLTQIIIMIYHWHKQRKEFAALRMSMVSECDYALSILDEIASGSVDGSITFKRLPIDYFRAIHKELIRYTKDHELFKLVSKVFVDMDLLNREVRLVYDKRNSRQKIAGIFGQGSVSLEVESCAPEISDVIRAARQGVWDSLMHMKNFLAETYGTEAPYDI